MRFVLFAIMLAAAVHFGMQTPAVRSFLMDIKNSGSSLGSHIVGNLTR